MHFEDRKIVIAYAQRWTIKAPSDVALPSPLSTPFEALGEPLDGLQCSNDSTCKFITVSINILQKHCRQEHGIAWKGDTSTLYSKVKVQTFFNNRSLRRYFVVNPQHSSENATAPDVQDRVTGMLAGWRATQQTHNEQAQVMEAEAAKTDRTGWFKRTGWLEHFAERNLTHLAHQARMPDRSEVKLKQAAELVEALMERSVAGLSTLARQTRRWLRSAQQTEVDQRPLARLQNPESQARYAGYMVRFVCYMLRIVADEEARMARGSEGEQTDEDGSDSCSSRSGSAGSDSDRVSDRRPHRQHRRRRAPDMMKDARELFDWQGRQKALAEVLWEALDGHSDADGMDALLELLAAFIFEPVGDQPFSSGLIHFTAVLGIDADMGRLRTAKNYSYMLAGIVYCVRVLGVEKLLPAGSRAGQTNEDREYFLLMRSRFLADGSYSPMSEILSLLAYGKAVALTAGNSGNAYWLKDRKTFYLNGQPIVISRFRKMAQDLVAEAEDMLWGLLWTTGVEDRFAVELKRIVDDVTFPRRGVSFVTQRDNALDDGLEWMLKQALQSREGRTLQKKDGTWKTRTVKQYLRRVDRFLALLMLGVHMTSGQPGRGSEVTTMRHRNGMLQDRNVFVVDGQVMTVVRYHKSQSQWDKPKVVPRFLPPRLGQVMAVYLAYLQPFQEYLAVEVLGGGFNDYVWADEQGPWGTDRLTRALKRESGKRLGVELTTLDYRHTAVGIGRVVVGEAFGKGYQDEVGEVEEAEVDEAGESALELQNSRTTVMGIGNYSVPMDIIKHLSVRSIETFRPLSMQWHCFLGLAGKEEEANTARKRKRSDDRGEGERDWGERDWGERDWGEREKDREDWEDGGDGESVGQLRGRKKRQPLDSQGLRKAMQQALGQGEVSFRSAEQEQAMHAVVAKHTPLVVVLPTGGGKSLLFTVPACLDNAGTTVVVVPYRALIEDLVGRIQGRGIDCIEWKHGESNAATVVVVSADLAGDTTSNGNFLGYAGMLSSRGLLERVVVDECHLVFTSSDWRPKLAKLKNLRVLACPMVLLTATLPPVREVELEQSMGVRCATYIRASTVRVNTRYLVSWCARGKAPETAVAMGRRQQQLLAGGEKGIVYSRSKQQCEQLAEALGCLYYHADVADRDEPLAQWLGAGGLMVATSALGTGLDFGGIVFILHVGMPWSLTDFAQESGRGGRGGERVDSVIVVEEGEVERTMKQKAEEMDVQAMGMFIIGEGCRRGLMSSYVDGRRVECREVEAAGCDRCGEGLAEWQDEQTETSRAWEQVQGVMDEMREGCAVCWALAEAGTDGWQKHKTMQCTAHAGVTGMEVDGFRREIRDGGGSHSCRRCWVSQKYCATGEDVANRCQWPNIVVPLARAAGALEAGVEMIRACGYTGELGGDWKEYAVWLGKRHRVRVWGEYFSNVLVVAIRMMLFERAYNSTAE